MTEIFETILRMSGVASLVIITVIIVRFCLKSAPKKFSYILWALVLVRLLCPFTVESRLSAIPENSGAEALIEDFADSYVGPTNTYFDNRPEYYTAVEAGIEPIVNHGTTGGNYVVTAPDGVSPPPTVETEWMPTLAIIWLCGIAAMTLWAIADYIRLKLRLRTAIRDDEDIYVTDAVDSPFVLGLLRPRIYLPLSLEGAEKNYILLHERCHLRRGDHWIKLLAFAALALHWFNPLVWLAFVLSNRDMEMSCDEAVIVSLGGKVRADYSASLLALATGHRRVSVTPLAFGEGDPKSRIENLAKWRKPGRWMLIAGALVCIVAAVCLLTDPVSKAQINIYGSVYTYAGRESNLSLLAPGGIDLGELEGIIHDSDEPPTGSHYATNLDEKYAGQPLLLQSSDTLYLYDEKGFYLVFELEEGYDVPEIPNYETMEVARGDFDRDGREDYIVVDLRPARTTLRIRIIDAETEIVLWSDECSAEDTQQRAYIHRLGENGLDSLIIDAYEPATGKVSSREIYLVDGREKVVERSESTLELPETGSEEEFTDLLRLSLPQNSVVLLSTIGKYTLIGPIYAAERHIWAEPAELFSGDYDHDGEDETVKFATMGYDDVWELWVEKPNGQTIWREGGFAEAHAGWNSIFAYEASDGGDYLVRYNPAMFQGNATYICEVFHIENGEEVIKDAWRVSFSQPTEYTQEMADFAAAAENILSDSYLLLSTLGGELHVGPTRGDISGLLPVDFGFRAEEEAWETFCKAAFADMMAAEVSHYTWDIYNDGVHRTDLPHNEGWFLGDEWMFKSNSLSDGESFESVFIEREGAQYAWSRIDGVEQLLTSENNESDAYGRHIFDNWLGYEMEFVSKTESADGLELVFEVLGEGEKPNKGQQTYIFDKNVRLTEARFDSDVPYADAYGTRSTVRTVRQTIVVTFPRVSEALCRLMINEAYTDIMAAQKAKEAAEAPPIIDDGSSYPLAIPYGRSVITDLDGDGVKETVCQSLDYRKVGSLMINGVEYFEDVQEVMGYPQTADEHRYGDYYIVDLDTSDGKLEITVYDGGPSADPVTHFFGFDSKKAQIEHRGSVEWYAAKLLYDGKGNVTQTD